jgi:hypothetical protein
MKSYQLGDQNFTTASMKIIKSSTMKVKAMITLVILIFFAFTSTWGQSAFDIKKWKGRYPRMNNDYPMAFVSWPTLHFFVRIYPLHYYYYLNPIPVYDTKSYLETDLYDGLKLMLKNIDRNALPILYT